MPSKTPAQARFMRAAAHDPEIAKANKIPQSVAREFTQADKAASRFKLSQPKIHRQAGTTGKRKG